MRNECLAAALDELAKAGIREPAMAHGGKHVQVRWVEPGGEARLVTVAGTPGDSRSIENTRRDVRRVLRVDGMLDEGRAPPPRQPSRIELLPRRVAELERRVEARMAAK